MCVVNRALADMLTVTQALTKILAQCPASFVVETVALPEACGRVLAEDIVSLVDVPPCDNSAMDGYALHSADIRTDGALPLQQYCHAGDEPIELVRGTCARIFTGAPVPHGADTVVMQENTLRQDAVVKFTHPVFVGDNIRLQGQDIAQGACVLEAGRVLSAADIGLLASIGAVHVPVARALRVALINTGEELVDPGMSLKPGQIYNSNRFLLSAMLRDAGCEIVASMHVGDDLATTQSVLDDLARQADVLISTGGVSVGEEDHVKTAVATLGTIDLWQIAIKPGKPLVFGKIRQTFFFGLPGNPVSAFVTFLLFVKPFLLRTQGVVDVAPLCVNAVANFEWPTAGKREEYLRGRMSMRSDGVCIVDIHTNQSSGVLSSVSWANALVKLPAGAACCRGDIVSVVLLGNAI